MMTAGLNVLFALAVVLLAGTTGVGHALGWSWRTDQLLLCSYLALPALVGAPFILESPRFLLNVRAPRSQHTETQLCPPLSPLTVPTLPLFITTVGWSRARGGGLIA